MPKKNIVDQSIIKEKIVKKGRKPKGGKLILNQIDNTSKSNIITNIILHLKCTIDDLDLFNKNYNTLICDPLQYEPSLPKSFVSYNNENENTYSVYDETNINNEEQIKEYEIVKNCDADKLKEEQDKLEINDINQKLKCLKVNLYKNIIIDKKPACFWCTFDFDNPPCYIPKYEIDGVIFGYGAFCLPECAAAYLLNENIDDSCKFERLHLLNHIYGKIYNYKKSIKPSPNPFYLLDKFYGNLSIQEYRRLLKSEHLLLIIDKPMTRILPELHEDSEKLSDNYSTSYDNKNKTKGCFKVKRQSDANNGPTKTNILRENFGL
jgi:hypothetical protein